MVKRDTVVQSTAERLRELISNDHAEGERLPGELLLAERLDVSRASVREALGMLTAEGLVERRWGVGTFVTAPGPAGLLDMSVLESYRSRIEATGRTVRLGEASCELGTAPEPAAAALGVGADVGADGTGRSNGDGSVWVVTRRFFVDGMPSALQREYIPQRLYGRPVDAAAMLSAEVDLFTLLNRHRVGTAAHAVTDVEAVAAEGADARALEVPEGTPVLRTEQAVIAADGGTSAFGIALHRSDVVRLRIRR
ncbi:MAG TPA: GntR family transcriptional regulator [Gryllotalpicola sp.]